MATLTDKTIKIRYMSKNIVNNFIQIGKELKEVRDTDLFKENFLTFTDYLHKEHPQLSDGFVFRLLKVVEDEKLVASAPKLGITKTLELLYVPDREIREELTEKAIKEDLTTKDIREEVKKTKISPERPPLIDTEEERKFKLLREYDLFKGEVKRINEEMKELYDKYIVWNEKASKYASLGVERDVMQELFKNLKGELE
ncbi:hypothetical protein LCGC14_1978240 [marine sediment metagenome]|uniref:Uncharacterized protein n=1 Tax=marine sediment metagenome TaxID=412755 RepID=A0A0F9FXW3_9ZZZZ